MELYEKIYIFIHKKLNQMDNVINCYRAREIPPISIEKYIIRLYSYSKISDISHICSLILLDRLLKTTNIKLNIFNFHRLYCTSLRIASKIFDEYFKDNTTFASISGLSLQELNYLEKEYLRNIQWDLFIDFNTYSYYVNLLAP